MKTVDLFAGCGGLSLGFQNQGFEIVEAFDNWEKAIKIYEKNFKHKITNLDLSSENAKEIIKSKKAEIIIGGSPCQDFSSAGKLEEKGRADLTLKFAKIIEDSSPEWFVMENVERITKSNILKEAKSILKNNGYGLTEKVLKASFFGIPQSRKRFFLIGHKNSEDNFLNNFIEEQKQEKETSIFDYLGTEFGLEYYYRHPRSYARRGIFSIYEPSPTIRGVNRPVPKGYLKHNGDPVDVFQDLRPLTTKERSLIQTFPKEFVFEGTKTDIEQIIGNAVPVKLAEVIAKAINNYKSSLK